MFQFQYGAIGSAFQLDQTLYMLPFQFQYGAIGSNDVTSIVDLVLCFNSSMVRLVVTAFPLPLPYSTSFQFQYGAIGRDYA